MTPAASEDSMGCYRNRFGQVVDLHEVLDALLDGPALGWRDTRRLAALTVLLEAVVVMCAAAQVAQAAAYGGALGVDTAPGAGLRVHLEEP